MQFLKIEHFNILDAETLAHESLGMAHVNPNMVKVIRATNFDGQKADEFSSIVMGDGITLFVKTNDLDKATIA